MELEKLMQLLENSNATIWRIETRSGVKRGQFEGETVHEAKDALRDRFSFLSPDTYLFKFRPKTTNEKGQDTEVFTIKNHSTNSPQPQNPMDSQLLIQLMQLMQMIGKMEAEMIHMKQDIKNLQDSVKDVYKDLTDDDKTNDSSAIDKLGSIVTKMPEIANAVKSFREM